MVDIEYEMTLRPNGINFGATGRTELEQNLRTILTTPKGSVPGDRNFGLEVSTIDAPTPVAQAKLTAKIIQAIRQYEPRVSVLSIRYLPNDGGGRLLPIIRYSVKE